MILCIGTTPAAQRVMRFAKVIPDTVNRAFSTLDGAAGKCTNVASVLKVLGEEPMLLAFLGGDRGEFIRRTMQSQGIGLEIVTTSAPTRQCITVIDQTTGAITELVEESPPAAPADFEQLIVRVRCLGKGARALVMSGTIAPGGNPDLYAICTRIAHEAGALSVLDAQGLGLHAALGANPGVVKPNRPELSATLGRELANRREVMRGMRELHERGAQRVVITAGRDPALAFDGFRFWAIHSPAIEVANPIGSGDAFTAALTWRLLRGDDLGEACRWGAAAGAANALTWMVGSVNKADVERLAPLVNVEALQG